MIENELRSQAAIQLIRQGYEVTLLKEDSKRAAFKEMKPFTAPEVQYWFRRRLFGIGILLRDILCVDIDGDEAMDFAEQHRLLNSPMRTKNGHYYFRHEIENAHTKIRFLGLPMDLKMTGYMIAPPTVIDSVRREWINGIIAPDELPLFNAKILDLDKKSVAAPMTPIVSTDSSRDYARALAYARSPKVQPAVAGANGHGRTIWLATRMLKLFPSLTPDQLMDVLRAFNEKCIPKWSEAELLHKVSEAFKLTVAL